jgi:hypothetical protein
MEIDNSKKADILLAGLKERYESLHKIRERVQSIGIYSLGILFGLGGWLIQKSVELSPIEVLGYLFGVLLSFYVLRFKFLEDLDRGFKRQQQVATRFEKALGLYEKSFIDNLEEPLYPTEWLAAGTENGKGLFIRSIYHLLYVGVGFVLIAILINGRVGLLELSKSILAYFMPH